MEIDCHRLTMKGCRFFHLLSTNNCSDFHQRFNIVVGLKQREPCSKEEEKNHSSGPDINGCTATITSMSLTCIDCLTSSLFTAFEENLRGSKTSGTRSICF